MSIRKRSHPQGFLFDMDGTLLISTQSPDQSWQEDFRQFAAKYSLSPDILLQALRESYVTYKKDIANDTEKQRRDRLDPFGVRQGLVESALAQAGIEDPVGAIAMARAYDALHLAFDIATPQRLGIFSIWFDPAGRGLPENSPIHPDQSIHVLTELLEPDGEGASQSDTAD